MEHEIKRWESSEQQAKLGYVTLYGGINSVDKGCPEWGTTDMSQCLFIGDLAGELHIEYKDGATDIVPLVFGYTMWFRELWIDCREPFVSDAYARNLLAETLQLRRAYEAEYPYELRLRLRQKPVASIAIVNNPDKVGMPVWENLRFSEGGHDLSLERYTVNAEHPLPPEISRNLDRIRTMLMTFEPDFSVVHEAPVFNDFTGPRLHFRGNALASIATNVYHRNVPDLIGKVEKDGMFHTSTFCAPSWRYNGFGTWRPDANSYRGSAYSRDCGRALLVLSELGFYEETERSLARFDEWLLYFPERYPELQLLGHKIHGHWTVIPNKPLIYSKELVDVGWPTRYTRELFGDHFQDFGNSENDGHGLLMLAHWKLWMKTGCDPRWVRDRWTYMREAADYISWAISNPDITFSEHGLLYSESEAGMNEITLYPNVLCYLGLTGYAKMAEVAGETAAAEAWNKTARELEQAIDRHFAYEDESYGPVWELGKLGFFHDPVLTMCSDFLGYDIMTAIPKSWVLRSSNTYLASLSKRQGYFAPAGLGYDHGMLTQSALLLDLTEDYTKLVGNMAKMCYSPRLPDPYIIPECAVVDVDQGVYRRQGDLGNLVHQAEVLKVLLLVTGISEHDGMLHVMPRLPEGWETEVSEYPLSTRMGMAAGRPSIGVKAGYPAEGKQHVRIKLKNVSGVRTRVRIGPFPVDVEKVNVETEREGNKTATSIACFQSGDRAWGWVDVDRIQTAEEIGILVQYG